MRRGGSIVLFSALATTGLAAGLFVSGRAPSANASRAGSKRTTRVRVTATDSRFKLSKGRAVTGTVIFTVTNRGKVPHDFKIAGKKTPRLAPRHSATVRVTLSQAGRYPYRSTVRGQAAAGLKGIFVAVPAPAPPPTTTTTSTTIGHAQTTVNVGMFEQPTPHFELSQAIVPSGMVTFAITSYCDVGGCSFDLLGIHAGAILFSGQETWTVALPPGTYNFHCDVAPQLMNGILVVTP